jgi:hypothetical protein
MAAPGARASATGRMGTRPMVLGLRSGRDGPDAGDRAQHWRAIELQPWGYFQISGKSAGIAHNGLVTVTRG